MGLDTDAGDGDRSVIGDNRHGNVNYIKRLALLDPRRPRVVVIWINSWRFVDIDGPVEDVEDVVYRLPHRWLTATSCVPLVRPRRSLLSLPLLLLLLILLPIVAVHVVDLIPC